MTEEDVDHPEQTELDLEVDGVVDPSTDGDAETPEPSDVETREPHSVEALVESFENVTTEPPASSGGI